MTLEESPLDLELLDENADLGLDSLNELIDLYLAQADETMAGLRTAVAAGDAVDVGRLAHKLAGSSAVCGVKAMTSSLRALEQRSREGRLSEFDQLLAHTSQQLESCRRLLAEYLAEKGRSPSAAAQE
jgi:HPt (histidine-containing phosphotransfer) domain-containing protein